MRHVLLGPIVILLACVLMIDDAAAQSSARRRASGRSAPTRSSAPRALAPPSPSGGGFSMPRLPSAGGGMQASGNAWGASLMGRIPPEVLSQGWRPQAPFATGHPSRFMEFSHYYPSFRRR